MIVFIEVTIDQQDDLPVPLRQARSRRRHIDGNGRNKTNIDRCPKSCRGRRGKKGDKGEQGVPGVCLTNCSAAPPMTFAHLAGIQAPSNSSDLFHFKAPESEFASGFRVVEGNKVEILDSGVFFVYSQVTYNNVAARNGFLVKIRRTPEGPPESFVSCILGSSGVTPSNHSGDEEGANLIYKPCFTAGTVHLEAGATLWMEHPYTGPGHDIKLMPHLTFLGLIRLSPG
ncbi:hypothetical protein CAPTEDRAFT_213760 [Capitella teleta]|uniref:THD domain-containing protein n=1 Tax=Capitella teleta TaxID=283909 RepID=R7U8A9_CAPTE|nr:hypothetical protein CAPTEDRAFT_213760 [Capitella teleta]|eukprot:ELU02224.1 hypothetical protein CAPTEDRAFT_213760 [Capitella teleta]